MIGTTHQWNLSICFFVCLSMKRLIMVLCAALLVAGCSQKKGNTVAGSSAKDYTQVQVPDFSADSALSFAKAQLDFGPRTPNSQSASQCEQYLVSQMNRWCDTVIVQKFSTTLWNNTVVNGSNIIGSINPAHSTRILLAAHWDSRLWADHDSVPANQKKPIPGANDGASGVSVLMELARVMAFDTPDAGIDFIFFDVEDQGIPEWADEYKDNTWCLGSQYWAQYPHVPFYKAIYGVLLDMVGTPNPRFTMEEVSRKYAPHILNKYWNAAASLGYSNIFVKSDTDPILDDHLYVNQIAGIPTIDLVQNTPGSSFFPYWHTMGDNFDALDASTMKVVGNLILKVIYGDYDK